MVLKDLIERLKQEPKENVIRKGFGRSMSYRGDYSQLAFAPSENVTVGSMLEEAEYALGKTYQGYKGGDFVMDEYTYVFIAEYGSTGEQIGKFLLDYMLVDIVS